MTDRRRLVEQLLLHEGVKLKVYSDTKGIPTIGVGRNLRDKGLSFGEAMELLAHDIDESIADLVTNFPWFAELDAVRQRAAIDMRFNLGPGGFRGFRRMIRMLSEGNYQRASESARDSLWFKQVKGRGVRLATMIQTGEDYR